MQYCKIACYTPTWTTAVSSEVHVYTTILVMCMTEKDTQIVIWAWFGFIICHASRCVCTFECVVHIIRILGGKHYCVSFRFLNFTLSIKITQAKGFWRVFISVHFIFPGQPYPRYFSLNAMLIFNNGSNWLPVSRYLLKIPLLCEKDRDYRTRMSVPRV